MKLIKAIVKPFKLEEIKEALSEQGIEGMTVTEVRIWPPKRTYRNIQGSEYTVDFLPKVLIEIVVDDSAVEKTTQTIISVAKTGKIGDGKVFVLQWKVQFVSELKKLGRSSLVT